jgi:hypothetical protein
MLAGRPPFQGSMASVIHQHLSSLGPLILRQAFIEVPQLTEEPGELYRIPISSWPPFIVKVDALSLGKVTTDYLSEPAQTVVDNAGLDFPANPVQQLAWVIYELLGGVRPAPAFDGAV